jgi:hypothetical protein
VVSGAGRMPAGRLENFISGTPTICMLGKAPPQLTGYWL